VWDKRSLQADTDPYAPQRWAAGTAAAAVAAYGLSRRSWGGRLVAIVGSALVMRALAGHNDFDNLRARLERVSGRLRSKPEDLVEDASDASFPASDPPAFVSPTRDKDAQMTH
jgi:uncharacterized membrane protein